MAIVGMRLWPWDQVMSLPGNGSTGIDPAVGLVGYLGVSMWIGSARNADARKCLLGAGWIGLVAGLFLSGALLLSSRPGADDPTQSPVLRWALTADGEKLLGVASSRTVAVRKDAGCRTMD